MFGQCALRTTLSKLTSELRWLFTFSQPFLGPFFLFLPNLSRPPYPSCVNGLVFSHPGLPLPLDSSTTASHGSNRAGLECCQCPFSYLALKIANRAAHGLFPFLLILSLPFPYGGRRGCSRIRVVSACRMRSQLPHTAPTGRVSGSTFAWGWPCFFWVSKRLGLLSVFA